MYVVSSRVASPVYNTFLSRGLGGEVAIGLGQQVSRRTRLGLTRISSDASRGRAQTPVVPCQWRPLHPGRGTRRPCTQELRAYSKVCTSGSVATSLNKLSNVFVNRVDLAKGKKKRDRETEREREAERERERQGEREREREREESKQATSTRTHFSFVDSPRHEHISHARTKSCMIHQTKDFREAAGQDFKQIDDLLGPGVP